MAQAWAVGPTAQEQQTVSIHSVSFFRDFSDFSVPQVDENGRTWKGSAPSDRESPSMISGDNLIHGGQPMAAEMHGHVFAGHTMQAILPRDDNPPREALGTENSAYATLG